MDKTAALEFIRRANSDFEVQVKLRALRPNDLAGLTKLATGLGYKFSTADFRAALGTPEVRAICDELQHVVGPLYVWKMSV